MQPEVLLERAAAAHRPLCEQKGIHLEVQTQSNLPAVNVDPERMAQVLGNLFSNALRYTPADGQILLEAKATPLAVELHVQDNGSGIPIEDQPYVFERSFRADKARSHNSETGLGLAIAKSLVEAQGGSIRLESAPDPGAHFVISFPR
jgi:signal transduction histidine kinase